MSKHYTPQQIADAMADPDKGIPALSVRCVRDYLNERFPDHFYESWWRLSEEEYATVLNELRAARIVMFHQPRRALHRKDIPLPLF